jgi:hypothetical protein
VAADDGSRTQAATVLSLLVDWSEEQSRAIGRGDVRPALISTEAQRLERWIDTLAE